MAVQDIVSRARGPVRQGLERLGAQPDNDSRYLGSLGDLGVRVSGLGG